MYDDTDVALVLGLVASSGFAIAFLIAAFGATVIFLIQKGKPDRREKPPSARLAIDFLICVFLCSLSIATGVVSYQAFDHRRGDFNPPSHVAAVAIGAVWGPIASAGFAIYRWRRRLRS